MSFQDSTGYVKRFTDGELVFAEGEPADNLYIVLNGTVVIRKEGELVTTVLAEFGPGDMFGELSLIDQRPHSASALAKGVTEIAIYDKETFVASLRDDPDLALRVIESLANRLRATTDQLQQVCTQYVLDRTEMALIQKAVLENDVI
jgi:CRP/FNR family transcriptional regulator